MQHEFLDLRYRDDYIAWHKKEEAEIIIMSHHRLWWPDTSHNGTRGLLVSHWDLSPYIPFCYSWKSMLPCCRFPLFLKGSEKALFQYAVYLLNKDIAQVWNQLIAWENLPYTYTARNGYVLALELPTGLAGSWRFTRKLRIQHVFVQCAGIDYMYVLQTYIAVNRPSPRA